MFIITCLCADKYT